MSLDLTVSQYLILSVGLFLGFYIHSIIGFAAALIALPIISQCFEVKDGVSLMSLFVLVFSVIFGFREWRNFDKRVILRLLWGMLPGVAIGTWVLSTVDSALMKRCLGAFILLFVLNSYLNFSKLRFVEKMGVPFGFLGGFFSVLFSAAGPPFAIYIYSCLDSAKEIRATLISVLFLNSIIRVPALAASGLLTPKIWIWALCLSPVFAVALFLGNRTHAKIDSHRFKNILMPVLTLSAILLFIS